MMMMLLALGVGSLPSIEAIGDDDAVFIDVGAERPRRI
jgi:hypothetical protein